MTFIYVISHFTSLQRLEHDKAGVVSTESHVQAVQRLHGPKLEGNDVNVNIFSHNFIASFT